MPSITAIELGSDTCALARTSVRGDEMRVTAVEILDPSSFPGIDSFTKAVKQVRRTLKLPRRARAVVWGLPDGASRRDPVVKPLIEPLIGAGFRIDRVVSPCNALAALARLRTPRPEAATCWLAVNRGGVAIVAVRPGKQLYAHSFIWDSSIGSTGSQARMLQRYSLVSYLAPEVKRAINAARQKGTPVEAIVTCGNLPDLRSLTMPLIEELDVEVETLDSLEGLVVKPDLADRLSDTAASIRIACAGAIARATRERNEAFAGGLKRGRLITAAAVGVAVFAAGWFLYGGMIARRPPAGAQSPRASVPPRQQPSAPTGTRGSLPRANPAVPTPPKTTAPTASGQPPAQKAPAAAAPVVVQKPAPAPAPTATPAPVQKPPSVQKPTPSTTTPVVAQKPAVCAPPAAALKTQPTTPPPAPKKPVTAATPAIVSKTAPPPQPRSNPPPAIGAEKPQPPARTTIAVPQDSRIPAAPPRVEPLPKPQPAQRSENPAKPEVQVPKTDTARVPAGPPPRVAPPSAALNIPPPSADRVEAGKAPQSKPLPPLLKDPLPRVTAILVANDRRYATIDEGHIITIGDVIGRRVVVGIDERAVVLREPSGVQIRVALGGRLEGIDRAGR